MASNDNVIDQDLARKIQVWANADESEFAICLDIDGHHFRAKTDMTMPDAKFVKKVDETDFVGDLKYYWVYTLEHWIQRNKARIKGN